jgi:hypothetical protein
MSEDTERLMSTDSYRSLPGSNQHTSHAEGCLIASGILSGMLLMILGSIFAFGYGSLYHGLPSGIHSSSFRNQTVGGGLFLGGLFILSIAIYFLRHIDGETDRLDTTVIPNDDPDVHNDQVVL